jgi:hypothetical protein
MDYEDFLSGIMWTQRQWVHNQQQRKLTKKFPYEALTGRGEDYWLHLEKMDETKLGKEIITNFLNTAEWSCHLDRPGSAKGKEMVQSLKKAVDRLPEYYAALKGLNIGELDFMSTTVLAGKSVPISPIIAEIYATYCAIKPRFGPVPTSKLMHMALPELFIMWDNAIIKEYHVPSYPSDKPQYLSFLVLMQENARHIKETGPAGSNVSWEGFLSHINAQCGYKALTMTRLLDIANYAVGHPEKQAPNIRCKRCCEGANARIPGLEAFIKQYLGSDINLGRFRC